MKHRTIATALILTLLLVFLIWSFGSSAANPSSGKLTPKVAVDGAANEVFQERNEEEVDADLGKWASRSGARIEREEYLRARGEYIARKRGIEPGRPFNPELRGEAIDQMERQEKGRRFESIIAGGDLTPAAGGAWTPIGPMTIANGQALSGGDTSVSGRVTAVAVDPTNPNNVYLGTAQGGVWRSTNGGTTWQSIFDDAQTQAIGALAVPPSDPSILYVGTGEFNGCADCFFGAGLYRIDGVNGGSPTLAGPINPTQTVGGVNYTGGIFNGRGITKIVVDPTNAATIFLSTARGVGGSGANALSGFFPPLGIRGLWRSTNATSARASVTFEKLVVTATGSLSTENLDTTDIVMEPGVPNNLLVAMIGSNSSNGGIYRTTNALSGTPTFTQVYNPAASGVRISLTIAKVASIVTAFAATSETPNNTLGCTTPGSGAVRKQIDPFNLAATWGTQLTGGGGFCSGQCFYDMPIAVNPANANDVYLGGAAGNSTSGCGHGMKKSVDGGTTFVRDQVGLHADAHALTFDGAGNIYAGNDGGVWRKAITDPATTSWTNLNSAPLNTLQFESIAVHPTDQFLMIGGTQDNGTEYQQTSSGNWRNAEGGDGGYSLIDQSATDTVHVNMYHTFFNQTGTQIGFDRAVDTTCLPIKNFWPTRGAFGGSNDLINSCDGTANYIQNGIQITDTVLFYAPMALGPGSPNTVYFGTDRLYRSTDRGDSMTIVSQAPISVNSTGTNSPISSIAIWRGGDNVRMVGLQNGQVWATSTGSSTLINLTSNAFPTNPTGSTTNKFVGRVMIDPNNKNAAYVAFSFYADAGQGIWKITNLAAAAAPGGPAPIWTAAGNGIPSIPVNGFAIDPQNSNNLYAGTDIGVYFSNDGGANWSPFGTGLPRVAVFDLQIQPTSRILRAATHGRGIWELALVSPAASTIQFSAGSTSVTEGQVSTTVTVTRAGDTSFPATVSYATSDSAGAAGCSSANGSARCDYIQTLGTLNFAANETSKPISIPIVNDGYVEGAEQFTMTLSSPGGNNVLLGAQSTITITINDSGVSGTNPIDATDSFVREQYIDFLNREPDPAGLNFWMTNINNCGGDAGCREVQRINTSAAFFLSIEFQETGYLIERIYKAAYGDASASSSLGGTAHPIAAPVIRLNEFLPDTQRIGRGVVVLVGNWQQQLEDNKQAFTEEFVQRQRFLTAYPLTMTATQFVDALNDNAKDANANKPLSQAERDQLISDLTAGIKTRAQALRAVAEDQQLKDSESNRAFVLMQYYGYLRRNPNDAPEASLDYAGFEFWLNKLNQFNGDYVQAEMVKAFLSSIEYRQRFGS